MAAKRIDTVRIRIGNELVELPWKTSQRLRGRLVGAGFHSTERKFADKGTSAPIVLEPADKERVLGALRACMAILGDGQARELLPFRDVLQAEVGR